MDRYWLLTWTTYGTWLAGDERGFVSNVGGPDGKGLQHDVPGTPYDAGMPGLRYYMQDKMLGPPIRLTVEQAQVLVAQFQETAEFRGWELRAIAVMANHAHIVVGVPGDPEPDTLLRDFKSYGSRALNKKWGKPLNGTWWTESGSRRKLPNRQAVSDAAKYVLEQSQPLVDWSPETGLRVHGASGAASAPCLSPSSADEVSADEVSADERREPTGG